MAGFLLTPKKTTVQNAKDILAEGKGPRAQSSGGLTLVPTSSATGQKTVTGTAKSTPAVTSQAPSNNAWVSGVDDNGQKDYSVLLSQAMSAGASADEVQSLLDKRTQKALGSTGYSQYAYDDTYKAARDYISKQSKPQYQEFDASGYSAIKEAEDAYLKAQLEKTVSGLNAQKTSVNQSAEDAARQAYISYMQSQNTLPQALAASGYAGGMADSQRLALTTAFQNNQQEILRGRDTALNDIDTAVNNARLESSIQGAQAQADLARDAIAAYQSYLANQNAYANQDFWTKYGYDFQAAQDAANQSDTEYARRLAAAQTMAQMGNFDGYAELWGLSPETVAGLKQTYTDQNQTPAQVQAYESAWKMIAAGVMPSTEMLTAAGISLADAQAYAAYIKAEMAKAEKAAAQKQQVVYWGDGGMLDPNGTGSDNSEDNTGGAGAVDMTAIYNDTLREIGEIEDKGWSGQTFTTKILDAVEKAQRRGLGDEYARKILGQYGIRG